MSSGHEQVEEVDNVVLEKRKGFGKLHFVKRGGINLKDELGFCKAHAATCLYSYPMKLILPMHASCSNCQWVYPVNYGGGLVAGDSIHLEITVDEDCCVMLTSQSSTKIYCSDHGATSKQMVKAVVKDRSLFACIPDPVTCFANAQHQQIQDFYLTLESNLIMVDWFTSGRIARGERWDFKFSHTTNSIYVDDVLYFRDSVRLTNSTLHPLREHMSDYNVVASCVIMGHFLESIITNIHNELTLCRSYDAKNNSEYLVCVSKLLPPSNSSQKTIPGIVIRMTSTSTGKVYTELDRLLKPLFEILGGNPFEGKF